MGIFSQFVGQLIKQIISRFMKIIRWPLLVYFSHFTLLVCRISECYHELRCAEREREILGMASDKKWQRWRERRNLFGWGPQNLKQIWTGATMGRAECKEKEAYGISSLHRTTQTAQGSGLCPSRRTSFHSLPLSAAPSQCGCWSCSDRSSLCCLPLGCRSFTGERSDQMEDDCPQWLKRFSAR